MRKSNKNKNLNFNMQFLIKSFQENPDQGNNLFFNNVFFNLFSSYFFLEKNFNLNYDIILNYTPIKFNLLFSNNNLDYLLNYKIKNKILFKDYLYTYLNNIGSSYNINSFYFLYSIDNLFNYKIEENLNNLYKSEDILFYQKKNKFYNLSSFLDFDDHMLKKTKLGYEEFKDFLNINNFFNDFLEDSILTNNIDERINNSIFYNNSFSLFNSNFNYDLFKNLKNYKKNNFLRLLNRYDNVKDFLNHYIFLKIFSLNNTNSLIFKNFKVNKNNNDFYFFFKINNFLKKKIKKNKKLTKKEELNFFKFFLLANIFYNFYNNNMQYKYFYSKSMLKYNSILLKMLTFEHNKPESNFFFEDDHYVDKLDLAKSIKKIKKTKFIADHSLNYNFPNKHNKFFLLGEDAVNVTKKNKFEFAFYYEDYAHNKDTFHNYLKGGLFNYFKSPKFFKNLNLNFKFNYLNILDNLNISNFKDLNLMDNSLFFFDIFNGNSLDFNNIFENNNILSYNKNIYQSQQNLIINYNFRLYKNFYNKNYLKNKKNNYIILNRSKNNEFKKIIGNFFISGIPYFLFLSKNYNIKKNLKYYRFSLLKSFNIYFFYYKSDYKNSYKKKFLNKFFFYKNGYFTNNYWRNASISSKDFYFLLYFSNNLELFFFKKLSFFEKKFKDLFVENLNNRYIFFKNRYFFLENEKKLIKKKNYILIKSFFENFILKNNNNLRHFPSSNFQFFNNKNNNKDKINFFFKNKVSSIFFKNIFTIMNPNLNNKIDKKIFYFYNRSLKIIYIKNNLKEIIKKKIINYFFLILNLIFYFKII